MRCPKCGAPSAVLDSRSLKPTGTRRRRECFNGHKWFTLEIAEGVVSAVPLTKHMHAAQKAAGRAKRDRAIAADQRPDTVVAEAYGVNRRTVGAIRKRAAAAQQERTGK